MAKKQYLDAHGLSTFWGKIKGYVDVPKISVAANDKFLSLTNNLVGATVTLRYDQATKQIGLYGKDTSTPVSTIDATDFVKDGILESVNLTGNNLVFTWNADSGKSATTIALDKFLDNVNFDGANLKLTDLPPVTDYDAPKKGDSLNTAIANLAFGVAKAMDATATHERQIASINQRKTSWANGGTITSETYYNILKGTQDSFTLPFDLNGFVSHITANGNAQRYSGVIIAVSYANTSEQPQQRSDTLYLPFAAVNAEKGVVAFEDLQFHYTDLASTDVDVRYKVTPFSNSQIKLEKVEASASLPWLEINTQEDIYKSLDSLKPGTGFSIQLENIQADAEMAKYCGLKVTDRYGNVWSALWGYIMDDRTEYYAGYFDFCGKQFSMHFIKDMIIFTNCETDLSVYAKKTDVETALNSKADIANTYNKTEVDAKLTGMVKIQKLTQEEYDALKTKDENVLYAIIEPAN